ncbi:MAG: hypothetical protein GY762_17025 [Proteobacteria bacterium]|nr:hypothetical protein [Pseudomonadota bacterium]
MTIVAIVLAMVALAYAFLTQRKLQDVTRRLARTNSHVYELSAQLETLEDKVKTETKQLSFEIKQASGQIEIGPKITIGEIQAIHPDADRILGSFHIGGCQSCAADPGETIADACERLEVNEAALLAALKDDGGETIPLTLSNIELQF